MSALSQPVLIAGAGIGGLTLALALARYDISSIILEREAELQEFGAGIQLSPNASHVLIALGLAEPLKSIAGEPDEIRVLNGKTGRLVSRLPLGAEMRRRYGAPYYVVHRADLQQILLGAVKELSVVQLHLGETVRNFQQDATHIEAETQTKAYGGTALIGADGLRSAVRQQILADGAPTFSGYVAWRGNLEAADLDPHLLAATSLWLGHSAHLVYYPIRQGRLLNVVAIVQEPDTTSGGNEADRPDRHYRGWCKPAQDLLSQVENWKCWPLFDREPSPNWGDGRATLLGDAAHATLPFVAQGGAMAIEDAAVLSARLGSGGDVTAALRDYEAERQPRTASLQIEARANGRIYHLPPILSAARDLVLTMGPAKFLTSRQDWIYRWRMPP